MSVIDFLQKIYCCGNRADRTGKQVTEIGMALKKHAHTHSLEYWVIFTTKLPDSIELNSLTKMLIHNSNCAIDYRHFH